MCLHTARSLQVGKFSFMANSRARSVDDTEGMVKFIADAKTDKILGVHIMGPNAGKWQCTKHLQDARQAGCRQLQ